MEKEILYLENMLKNSKCHLPTFINAPISKNLEKEHGYIKTQDYDLFFRNNIEIAKKIKEIPEFLKRYHTVIKVNFIQIGNIREEQPHLEYYDDVNTKYITNKPEIPQYILATYHYNPDHSIDFGDFFSLLFRNQSFAKFFHFLLDSYFYLSDSLTLLDEKGIYPIYLKETTIFFNERNRPILSCMDNIITDFTPSVIDNLVNLIKEDPSVFPVEFHVLDYLNREKKSVFSYIDLEILCKTNFSLNKDFQIQKFINKSSKQIIDYIMIYSMKTLNNYQLSLLYLKQLDKIMDSNFHTKYEGPIRKIYAILGENKGSTLTETREKILTILFS